MIPIFHPTNLCFIALLCLLAQVFCDQQTIINSLENKYKQKRDKSSAKSELLTNLGQQSDLLKMAYSELVQANIGAESAYRDYFNEKTRCQGLRPEFGFVGEVSSLPEDFCPSPPMSIEAVDQYTQIEQLKDLKYSAQIKQKIYSQQKAFNEDYFAESALNSRIRQIAFIPLRNAAEKYRACMSNYSSSTNPEPAECKKFQDGIAKYEKFYGNYRGYEVTFGMASKTPVFSLQIKKSLSQQAQTAYTEFQSSTSTNLNNLSTSRELCSSNMNILLTNVDQNLLSAVNARKKLESAKDKIESIKQNLQESLKDAKNVTVEINALSESLKSFFA